MTILEAPLQIYLHHAYQAVDQLGSQLPGEFQCSGTCNASLTLLRKSTEEQTLYSCLPLPSSLRPQNCQSTSGVICTNYFFLVLPDSIHFYFVTINSNFLLVRKEQADGTIARIHRTKALWAVVDLEGRKNKKEIMRNNRKYPHRQLNPWSIVTTRSITGPTTPYKIRTTLTLRVFERKIIFASKMGQYNFIKCK